MANKAGQRKNDGPIYPNITVKLLGENADAASILERCKAAMESAGFTPEAVESFLTEAQSGDYNKLLATCLKYFEVE